MIRLKDSKIGCHDRADQAIRRAKRLHGVAWEYIFKHTNYEKSSYFSSNVCLLNWGVVNDHAYRKLLYKYDVKNDKLKFVL